MMNWRRRGAGGSTEQTISRDSTSFLRLAHEHAPLTAGADVVEYPDSNKVASAVGAWPNVTRRFIFRRDAQVDYFDGEPGT